MRLNRRVPVPDKGQGTEDATLFKMLNARSCVVPAELARVMDLRLPNGLALQLSNFNFKIV